MSIVSQVDRESLHLATMISDPMISIDKVCKKAVSFFLEQKCGQEPYAAMLRRAFSTGKNARGFDAKKCVRILPRAESVIRYMEHRGSLFGRVVLYESIAHRYSDLWFLLNADFETKMRDSYLLSNHYATQSKLWKNVDSSIFWLALAYHRKGNLHTAKKYYAQVSGRPGPRFDKCYLFSRKIVLSKMFADPLVALPKLSDIDGILMFLKNNVKLLIDFMLREYEKHSVLTCDILAKEIAISFCSRKSSSIHCNFIIEELARIGHPLLDIFMRHVCVR